MALFVKNWDKFQHYKDRKPPWIKLYRDIIDDYGYHSISDFAAKNLILLWILASEDNGKVPSLDDLAWRLRLNKDDTENLIQELEQKGFLTRDSAEHVATIERSSEFGSRYISKKTRIAVTARDKGKCTWCGSAQNIEIDHITPISKGGSSELSNLQLLCRSCNRKKRACGLDAAEQLATQLRSQETETEIEIETEIEQKQAHARDDLRTKEDREFDAFWGVYPKKTGKKAAYKAFKQARKSGMPDGVAAIVETQRTWPNWTRDNGRYIPNPATWINQGRWDDEQPVNNGNPANVAQDWYDERGEA